MTHTRNCIFTSRLKDYDKNKRCKDAHLQKSKTLTYFEHNEGDASRIHIFFPPYLLDQDVI